MVVVFVPNDTLGLVLGLATVECVGIGLREKACLLWLSLGLGLLRRLGKLVFLVSL